MAEKKGKKRKSSRLRSQNGGQQGTQETETWDCLDCSKPFTEESEKMMLCDLCSSKHCTECIEMTDDEYAAMQALGDRDDAIWLCKVCLEKIKSTKNEPSTDDLDNMKSEMNNKFESLETQLAALAETIKTTASQNKVELTKSFAQVLVGENKGNGPGDNSNIEKIGVTGIVRNIVVEQRRVQNQQIVDKEEREKNIVIFKSKEADGETLEQKKVKDAKLAQDLLEEVGLDQVQIKGMFRLGKFNPEDSKDGKTRPLKICFNNKYDKESVMRNLYKLKGKTDGELSEIRIGHDLTQEERDMVKAKIEEAKKLTTTTVFYKVRGPPWALRFVTEKIIQK